MHDPNDKKIAAMLAAQSLARAQAEVDKKCVLLEGQATFVCYLDVDGFKQREDNDPKALYHDFNEINRYITGSFFGSTPFNDGLESKMLTADKLAWPYQFSDSYLVTTIDDSPEALRQICTVAAGIFMRLFQIGLPSRGGIAVGKTWWNPEQRIVLGPAVTSAYKLGKSIDCFGVAIDPPLAQRVANGCFTSAFPTPIKDGAENIELHYAALGAAPNLPYAHDGPGFANLYPIMASEYECSPEAKPHIAERYIRSIPIVEAMLIMPPQFSDVTSTPKEAS